MLFNWDYPAINATRPAIIITTIATHNSQTANTGNSRKMIKKIIAKPIRDPPLAWLLSTIFSPPLKYLVLFISNMALLIYIFMVFFNFIYYRELYYYLESYLCEKKFRVM